MIDLIRKELKPEMPLEEKIHLTREFLQHLLLKILYDTGQFQYLAFVGGTALRVLYGLNRYSEDVDFCLVEKKGYSANALLDKVKSHLKQNDLNADVRFQDQKNVHKCMIRFSGLLHGLGLSPLKDQKLSIYLEIDTNPPEGWNTQVSLVDKYFLFTVTHFDIPSLYATKLHACFYRRYTKGRDYYDLVWYLSRKVKPNFPLLNNAILQTEKVSAGISQENLYDFLRQKLERINFSTVQKDVERFLVNKEEVKLLNQDAILSLLR